MRSQRQHASESAAGTDTALQADLTAQSRDDLLHHGEADTGTFDSRLFRSIATDKLLENLALLARVDAHPLVAHRNRHLMIAHRAIHPNRAALG